MPRYKERAGRIDVRGKSSIEPTPGAPKDLGDKGMLAEHMGHDLPVSALHRDAHGGTIWSPYHRRR